MTFARSLAASSPLLVLAGVRARRRQNGITPISPKAGANVPRGETPDVQDEGQGRGPGLGPRLQVQEEGRRRRDLHRGVDRPGQEEGRHLPVQAEVLRLPGVLARTRPAPTTGRPTASTARATPTASRRARSSSSRSGRLTGRPDIGCSGWQYRDWRDGAFYPPKLPQRRWLEHYATRVRDRRGQQHLLPAGQAGGGRRAGWPRRRRSSSSPSRPAAT